MNLKICIVSAVNYRHMTMISIYLDFLKQNNIGCDIIYMDKYNDKIENIPYGKSIIFQNKINKNDSKFSKITKYFRFKKFAIKTIKENKYDFIIVWNDVAIYLLGIFLSRYYKNKYCLNIRDYFFQNNFLYIKYIFSKAIKNSVFTTISSEGFLKFLPKHNYVTIHSLNLSILNDFQKRISKTDTTHSKIKITFIGLVRFFENDKKLLDIFGNDNRFQINYFGTNANILRDYCEKKNITNVKFLDSFPVTQTTSLLYETDLINNLYGNESISLTQAISIKFYYGVYCKIPILVNKNTYGEEIVKKYNLGFVIEDMNNESKELIYNWYNQFEFKIFEEGCNNFLVKVTKDNNEFYSILKKTFIDVQGK